jgi:hypothetical protein
LICRFVDREAQFVFVPPADVVATAASMGAIPFDVPAGTPGVDLVHPPGGTSFDAIRAKIELCDPALDRIADIVRDADNDNCPGLVPEAAGLRAISLGLAKSVRDDQERLTYGLVIYDALYQWAARERRESEVFVRAPALWRSLRRLGTWISRSHEQRGLAELSDHLLRDLGVTREEVGLTRGEEEREAGKLFWHR